MSARLRVPQIDSLKAAHKDDNHMHAKSHAQKLELSKIEYILTRMEPNSGNGLSMNPITETETVLGREDSYNIGAPGQGSR